MHTLTKHFAPGEAPLSLELLRGEILIRQQMNDQALALAITLLEKPSHSDASRIRCLAFAAEQLRKDAQWESALELTDQAIELAPDNASIQRIRGRILAGLQRFTEAEQCLKKAVQLAPQDFSNRCSLAAHLHDHGHPSDAVTHLNVAINLSPDDPIARAQALNLMTRTQEKLGNDKEALRAIEECIASASTPDRILRRGFLRLRLGDWSNAWNDYESRWKIKDQDVYLRYHGSPHWRGEPLKGKRLLVYSDQGLGDALMLLRLLPIVSEAAESVVFEVQAALLPLLEPIANCLGVEVFARGKPRSDFDIACALMSLPGALQMRPEQVPFIFPMLNWKSATSPTIPKRIGISWRGSTGHISDHERSLSADVLKPLLELPDIEWICLQKDVRKDELVALPQLQTPAGINDTTFTTKQAMEDLDLVITIDSFIGHLAGLMGRPCWLLLHRQNDWRWMRDRNDSVWYGGHRLFRQQQAEDWTVVVDHVLQALKNNEPLRTTPSQQEMIPLLKDKNRHLEARYIACLQQTTSD